MIAIAVLAFTVLSCGVPKTVIQSKKVIKGTWNLDNIVYNQAGNFNMTVFNDTSKECFEGSTWRFIPNNNSGIYTINSTDCPTGERNFIFTIQQVDQESGYYDFLLKPTTKQGSANKNETVGYRVRLSQLSENSMQWEQSIMLDNKPFKFSMNFSKIQE